jgi:integrase
MFSTLSIFFITIFTATGIMFFSLSCSTYFCTPSNLKENGIREDVKYKCTIDFKVLLRDMKITITELSKKSGVSDFSITSVIKGNNVNYETSVKICDCLKLDIKNIFVADNKTLSGETIHHYHTFISSVLSTAVVWQIILSNPCERVKPPKVARKESKYLEENDLERLLEILDSLPDKDSQNALMIKILVFTGLRKGEICGLKFEDVDFDNHTINVKRNLLYLPGKGVFEDTPKNESSIRKISVSGNIIQLLRQHKISHMKKEIMVGDQWNETGYIFTAWNGSPLHPDTISAWFRKLVKYYDLPNVSIHSLRHTSATMLLMNGLPVKAVSSRLGHTNAVTTSQIYSHALQSVDKQAAEIMDGIMAGGEGGQKKKHG